MQFWQLSLAGFPLLQIESNCSGRSAYVAGEANRWGIAGCGLRIRPSQVELLLRVGLPMWEEEE